MGFAYQYLRCDEVAEARGRGRGSGNLVLNKINTPPNVKDCVLHPSLCISSTISRGSNTRNVILFLQRLIRRGLTSFFSKNKVHQSHYRPEVPRGFQEVKFLRLRDNGPRRVVRLSALLTGRLYPQKMLLVLISVRD